jgi:hypothetical protein
MFKPESFLYEMKLDFLGNMVSVTPVSTTAKQPPEEGRVGDNESLLRRHMIDIEREMEDDTKGALQ